jgi:leucyl-tRNA synthetase
VHAPWPSFDASKTASDEVELAIQVNGKLRDTVKVSKAISDDELRSLVLARESVKKWIEDKPLKKFIHVKGKLVSLVV